MTFNELLGLSQDELDSFTTEYLREHFDYAIEHADVGLMRLPDGVSVQKAREIQRDLAARIADTEDAPADDLPSNEQLAEYYRHMDYDDSGCYDY